MTVTVTIVRCYCAVCNFAVSAMSIGALVDAKKEHEAYVRWLEDLPAIIIPPAV
jgi:hypothetical protein